MEPKLLYHFNHPNGKMLDSLRKFNSDEELTATGWTEDPDKVVEPAAGKSAGFTAEQAEDADPDVLVGMVKSMGFHVLTDIELQAIKNVAASSSATDNSAIVSSLMERFDAEPTELNKEDLVVLGKEYFGLPLKMTMKEETLIGHISEAIKTAK